MNSQYKEKAVIRIVDDDEGFGDAIRFMLKTDGWLVSYYSETGTFLKKDDPDVPGCIILDYQMPLVNGLEFQDILAHKGYRQPIIFLTAHADVDMAISAFRSGAADILKKPISSEILLEAVASGRKRFCIPSERFPHCALSGVLRCSHTERKANPQQRQCRVDELPNCTEAWFKRTNGRDSSGQRL